MEIKLNKKDVKCILDKSFPDYTGRKFKLELLDKGREIPTESYWDGGTRSSYVIVSDELKCMGDSHQYSNMHPAKQYELSPRWIANDYQLLVEHSYFCGQDCGITIYATKTSTMIPKNLLGIK